MSISYAILGFLSWKPSTGYELKKIFEESTTMYWSGNNNQIYKALLQLQEEELVTNETIHQDGAPSKKIYTITEKGNAHLKNWVKTAPSFPEFKKAFLVQLAWADLLNNQELKVLLDQYEYEVKMQLLMHQEKQRRGQDLPERTPREKLLWVMISDNLISSYQCELEWIKRTQDAIIKSEV